MPVRVMVRPREYHDSVRLMQLSERVRRESGVDEAILMMATENNKKILRASGVLTSEASAARADDLVVAVVAATEAQAEAAMTLATEQLAQRAASAGVRHAPRTLDSALAAAPESNLALISVPGLYAAREARRALEQGLHVLLFSDNVSLADELALKRLASSKGLLMMGPDCGTSILDGVALGFANSVARGPVGIVGASGTGIQEISVLLDRMGLGISHAIGTGGRDLKEAIGGITMLQGLQVLAADSATELIVLTSKPPAASVARTVLEAAARVGKPVLVNFLGADQLPAAQGSLRFAASLEETALTAGALLSASKQLPLLTPAAIAQLAGQLAGRLQQQQRYIRALYAGGTLCYETLLHLRSELGQVYANIADSEESRYDGQGSRPGHILLDMGDDAYTVNRAHPMIDPTLRMQRILQEAADPEVAVLLLDLVLGFGAHADPASLLVETLQQARAEAQRGGRYLAVIVTICGTDADSQSLSRQADILRQADVLVANSNAEAARLAGAVIKTATATGG